MCRAPASCPPPVSSVPGPRGPVRLMSGRAPIPHTGRWLWALPDIEDLDVAGEASVAPVPSRDARFARLFTSHRDAMWRYCYRRVPADDVADAVASRAIVP